MKWNLLAKSGCVAAAMWLSTSPALGVATYEGNLYEALSSVQRERGAMGPIRSDETVKYEAFARYEGDSYDKFRIPSQALRGAMGPIRSDEPTQQNTEWMELQQRAPVLGGGNG